MMPHGSYSLGETAAKQKMVRLVCDKCGRRGQYRIDRLLEQYGPNKATEPTSVRAADLLRGDELAVLQDSLLQPNECEARGPTGC